MAKLPVGINVNGLLTEIGSSELLEAFFATVGGRLEPEGWGSRFPELMEEFYEGRLASEQAPAVLGHLEQIAEELRQLPPGQAIFDHEFQDAPEPADVRGDAESLYDYFQARGNVPLVAVMIHLLEILRDEGGEAVIEPVGIGDAVSVAFSSEPSPE